LFNIPRRERDKIVTMLNPIVGQAPKGSQDPAERKKIDGLKEKERG